MSRRKKHSALGVLLPYMRAGGYLLLVVALVSALGVGAALLLIDPNGFKPEIVDAARRATGREMQIRGPIRIALGLPPTLVAEDVALANAPGGSRPDMLSVERIELRVGLFSWLSRPLDVIQLTLVHPDLLLETDASGHGNWTLLSPAATNDDASAAGPTKTLPASDQHRSATRFAVRSVRIREMRVTWRNGVTAATASWTVPALAADAEEAGRSMLLNGSMVSGSRAVAITGEFGPIGRLWNGSAGVPWPLQVSLQTDGASVAVRGLLHDPANAGGYALNIEAAATDLTPIAALLPTPAPHLQQGTLAARFTATGTGAPNIASLTVHAVGVQVPSLLPGVDIKRFDLSAPAPEQPAHVDIVAVASDTPLHLTASLGVMAAAFSDDPARRQVPVELSLQAADALFTVKGTARSPANLSGLELVVLARVPNLATLGPVLRQPLPPLKQLGLDTRIDGQLADGAILEVSQFRANLPQADMTGSFKLTLGGRPALHGSLNAQQIDVDGLLESLQAPWEGAAAAPPAPQTQPVPAAVYPRAMLISDQPFHLEWLNRANADVQLGIYALQTNGVSYRNVLGHLVLQDGNLILDPVAGDTPGGKFAARLSVDSRPAKSPVSVTLRAPAMTLQPLAAAFGDADVVSGDASIDADLHGSGRSPHELAADLNGHLGLALSNGDMDNSLLTRALADVLKAAKLPEAVAGNANAGGGGRTKVRCFATRLNITNGVAKVATLVLDTTRMLVEGSGTLDLGAEQLALRLRPMLRAGPGIVVPATVGGSFLEPRVSLDSAAMPKGDLIGGVTSLLPTERRGDPCGPALAVARGDLPAEGASQPAPQAAPTAATKAPKPTDVLRRLLH